ncbi:MAG: DUF3298 domain-containing protein [Flavobacteriales bacterium]|nr:MAG: DUF3298 domain-containing protein [Flavobacteriales bacterium]
MTRFFIYLSLVFGAIACSQEAEVSSSDSPSDTLSYKYQTTEKTIGNCDQACLTIYLQSISIDPKEPLQALIDSLMLSAGSSYFPSKDAWIEASIKEFERLLEEIPSYDMPWEMERYVNIRFNRFGLISVIVSDYAFTGGAHPNSFWLKRVIDLSTNDILSWKDFVNADQHKAFTDFVERRFRKEFNINENESWEDAGFWFENDRFFLPIDFGIDASGMHFLYNVYEIAPYASGPITLSIEWNDVLPFLRKPYGDLFLEPTL